MHSIFEQHISCVDSAAAKDMAGTGKKKVPDFIQKATRRKDKVFYNFLAASLLYNFNCLSNSTQTTLKEIQRKILYFKFTLCYVSLCRGFLRNKFLF